jgi:hypothetical protein
MHHKERGARETVDIKKIIALVAYSAGFPPRIRPTNIRAILAL